MHLNTSETCLRPQLFQVTGDHEPVVDGAHADSILYASLQHTDIGESLPFILNIEYPLMPINCHQ